MGFTADARHEFADGSELLVGEDRHGWLLLFKGPNGLETTIRFDQVVFERNRLVCCVHEQRRNGTVAVDAGSIERVDFGAVGEWLRNNATVEALRAEGR